MSQITEDSGKLYTQYKNTPGTQFNTTAKVATYLLNNFVDPYVTYRGGVSKQEIINAVQQMMDHFKGNI